MKRYAVTSTASADELGAYRRWLTEHAAEVVLAGGFAGAEILERENALTAEYAAPEGSLEKYANLRAPALRAEAERLFPRVARERAVVPVAARVSAPFGWETLGLVDADGAPVPCPSDGPFTLHYVAPWCEDCRAAITALAAETRAAGDRAAFVGVFAPAADVGRFLDDAAPGLLCWFEPSERTDAARMRSFHAVLRQLAADPRRWGLPATRRLRIEAGRFVVRLH